MSTQPQIVRAIPELRATVALWRQSGLKVALVPTMGALHSGHMSLVRRAAELADRTVVSIFVNPSQFAPHEDLARYPRDEAGDMAKLAAENCHLVWAPTVADMYPAGFATRILPAGAAQGLESDFRPHFFGGVATVCAKLFGAVTPDVAVFGQKDYQQLCVIKQLVRDLDMPLSIVGVETAREPDGLALSSRNVYLSPAERQVAPALNRIISEVAEAAQRAIAGGSAAGKAPRPAPLFRDPAAPPDELELPELTKICGAAKQQLLDAGFAKVDYVAVREADTLRLVTEPGPRPLRVLAAATLGTTRLIDNVPG
ncbi:pantoate--beta-alanine ligase [Hyphomicrobium sp. NDB2Meth4]|uniref:pantoate--beta-alanine ligase n=1 Tax=Hyphomicrobium sp. NDB2Meth4 TaxID=1892846 RepID=UPI0009310165|nr:pantoate--beta-alanine ligase [Hyphomicrobium sp. NDB2Meth4]